MVDTIVALRQYDDRLVNFINRVEFVCNYEDIDVKIDDIVDITSREIRLMDPWMDRYLQLK